MSSDSAIQRPAISIPEISFFSPVVIYAILIVTLSVFLMHGWGILWAACVLLFWGGIYFGPPESLLPKIVLFLSLVCWPIGFVFWGPSLISMADSDPTGQYQVANDMRQIGLAVHNYESSFQHLPPAWTTDSDGRPMHSWRILLLPFLDSESSKEILGQYKMDQPWDSPHNLSAAKLLREPLFGDCSDPTLATYKLVSGPGTPFGPDTKSDLPSDTSKQVLVVEDNASPVLWTKPEDVTPQQVIAIFDANNNPDGLWKKHGGKRSNTYTRRSWFGMLDGSVEKAYPLSDSTKLLGFCSLDHAPEGKIFNLQAGEVPAVERFGSDDAAMFFPAMLILMVLMYLPAMGERRQFPQLAATIFYGILAVIAVPIFLSCLG